MRKLINHFLIFTITCLVHNAFAQQKFEKEYRLKTEEVPSLARQFVDSLDFNRRVRWYREISQNGKSIEAKSKFERRRYSVEFDTTGRLQDVEIEINFGAVPESVQTAITENLKNEFDRFRILKIQEQLTGTRKNLLGYLTDSQDKSGLTTKYELVLRGRKGRQVNKYEYTLTAQGKIEKRATVVFRNTDNLEY